MRGARRRVRDGLPRNDCSLMVQTPAVHRFTSRTRRNDIRYWERGSMTNDGVADPSPRRPLGGTGLSVSPICVGCAPLGNMPETFEYSVSEQRAFDTLRAVFESPLNFLDTAASYGDGESARRIGELLEEIGGLPEGYILASKTDRDLHTGDFSGEQMRRSVERSLRLLGMDRLQLVYLHDPEH